MGILYLDINECSSNPCATNAMCTDVPGSFSCACNSGYSGDGFTCQSMFHWDYFTIIICNGNFVFRY